MKNYLQENLFIKNQISNSQFVKVEVTDFHLINTNFNIKLKNVDFNKFDEVSVILKNIKTKEIYICNTNLNKNSLILELSSLNYLCSDNEYMILILCKKDNYFEVLYPIFKDYSTNISTNYQISTYSKVSWYLRIIDTGEFRLSTILKSNYCS